MQKQTLETDRPAETPLRLIQIITASTKERICYDLDAALPDGERYLVDCGTLGRLDSRRLYRPLRDGLFVRISNGAVVSLPRPERPGRHAPSDDERPDALYRAEWGIVGEYPGSRCTVYFEEGTEIEL